MRTIELQEKHPYLRNAVEKKTNLFNTPINYLVYEHRLNDVVYAKYYILNLDEVHQKEWIYSLVEDMDKFCEMQQIILSDDYYLSPDDLKFNLYLIILTDNIEKIKNLRGLQNNFSMCRKLVFDEKMANLYFYSFECLPDKDNGVFDALHRNDNSDFSKKLAAVDDEINKKVFCLYNEVICGKKLFLEHLESTKKGRRSLRRYLSHIYLSNNQTANYNNNIDAYNGLDMYGMLFHEFYHFQVHKSDENKLDAIQKLRGFRNKEKAIDDENILNSIRMIYLNDFRNFKNQYPLKFSRVNLLFGDNGAGKTSIIEAIKSVITGDVEDDSLKNVHLIGVARNGKEMRFNRKNSQQADYAHIWYNTDKSRFTEYFDKYNNFNGGRALNFALNDWDIVNLFVDTPVYRVYKDLYKGKLRIVQQIEDALEYFEEANIVEKLPKTSDALKTLNRRNIVYKKNEEGVYSITLQRPLSKYNKEIQKAISRIRYDNLTLIAKKIENNQKLNRDVDISSGILEELGIYGRIENLFLLLTTARDYYKIQKDDSNSLGVVKVNSDVVVEPSDMSAGQRVCFAFATQLVSFLENSKAPNIVILDEPVANLDDLHFLNMLDIIRQLAINGSQIFFTTANESVAKIFKRKFGFMKDDFSGFRIRDIGNEAVVSDYDIS